MRTYSLKGIPAAAARCSKMELVSSARLTFFIGYSFPIGFDTPERDAVRSLMDYSDALWAADALAAMLERVRRAVLAEYLRRIAEL